MYRIRISLLSVLILTSFNLNARSNGLILDQWKICQEDSDCQVVHKSACRPCCNQVAIHKNTVKNYKERVKKLCTEKLPSFCKCTRLNHVPVCRKNRCEIYYNNICCGENAPKNCANLLVDCTPNPIKP